MTPIEKQNEVYKQALAIQLRTGSPEKGPGVTVDQALRILEVEQLWRLASINHKIYMTLDELKEAVSGDVSDSLDMTHKRLNEIEQTLFDTLGSEKTGAALDAIAAWGGGSPE